MGKHRLATLLVLLLAAGAVPAYASGNANFLFGGRQLRDKDFWEPTDGQGVAGVIVDFGKDRWPIHLCLANMGSSDDSGPFTASLDEMAFGVMKVWEPKSGGAIRPFLGGGGAVVTASLKRDLGGNTDLVEDDSVAAFYLDGGVFWRTGKRFNVGLGVRYLTGASLDLAGSSTEPDYLQVHVLAGFGWPRRERKAAP